jgi:hypothetical protein
MQIKSTILTTAGLGLAATLTFLATPSEGWSTIGGDLGNGQRDFRIYDNFSDTQANNNTTADPNFPGYTGVEMAIWKGSIEWGSELHGNGDGDPSQAFGLGSGGANFDPSMQGNATSTGGSNDNVHSELSGDGGGVLAYTETPISDGWRIRYYREPWIWTDGPGTGGGGGYRIDIQGVACHEYGHGLGLGHSTVGGATMYPSISGNGVAARSISNDDSAGVQYVYGVASSSKPSIASLSLSGSTLTITGSGFSSSNNVVWFTQAGTGGSGTPVKVTGVSSSGGQLSVTVPGNAGSGDVMVKNSGSGHSSLSNAYPFDTSGGGGSGPANDDCANAEAIFGPTTVAFDNTGANTDGGSDCSDGGSSDIEADVWFMYTALASGGATVSTCGLTSIDTKIAVYDACGGTLIACNDDACGSSSEVSFSVTSLTSYVIRLGNYPGTSQGSGNLSIVEGTICSSGISNYCTSGANSTGGAAIITATGTPSIAANDIVLHAFPCPPYQFGLFFYGPNQINNPFGNGRLCVGGGIYRLGVVQMDAFGIADRAVDLTNPPQASGQIVSGSSWNFQFWFRDPGLGAGYDLSDGVEISFCD